MQPLAFALLAGLLPAGWRCELWDERLEPIPQYLEADLVAITIETYTARRGYRLADRYRAQGIPVVVGGYHPSFLPEEALQHADSVVIGDADRIWSQVLSDVQQKKLQQIYQGSVGHSMQGLQFDRSIFAGKKYGRIRPVLFSRGCRFACDFCSIHAFYGRSLTCRPTPEVMAELAALDSRQVFIVDDNLLISGPQTQELLRGMRGLGLRWGAQISLDVSAQPELLEAMAASGCVAVLVGFESLQSENLAAMRKKWNSKHPYREAISRFHQHGILVYGSFIFGYDSDNLDVFARTLDFALENQLFLVNFSALAPTPATDLYDKLQSQGRLLFDSWWLDPDYRYGEAVYRPALMTPQQLTQGCRWARQQFYRYANIAQRVLWPPAGCQSWGHRAVSLAGNWTSRRALDQKLGRPLG